jgi:hypothetical protein
MCATSHHRGGAVHLGLADPRDPSAAEARAQRFDRHGHDHRDGRSREASVIVRERVAREERVEPTLRERTSIPLYLGPSLAVEARDAPRRRACIERRSEHPGGLWMHRDDPADQPVGALAETRHDLQEHPLDLLDRRDVQMPRDPVECRDHPCHRIDTDDAVPQGLRHRRPDRGQRIPLESQPGTRRAADGTPGERLGRVDARLRRDERSDQPRIVQRARLAGIQSIEDRGELRRPLDQPSRHHAGTPISGTRVFSLPRIRTSVLMTHSSATSTSTFPTTPDSTASCAAAIRSSGNRCSGSPAASPTGSASSAATTTSAPAVSAAGGTV